MFFIYYLCFIYNRIKLIVFLMYKVLTQELLN